MNRIIKKAQRLLKPIGYKPEYNGYYILINGSDYSGETYCKECAKEIIAELKERRKLNEYPANTKFEIQNSNIALDEYATGPESCNRCNSNYFNISFYADIHCAKFLLAELNCSEKEIEPFLKWALNIAFSNYEYLEEDVKKVLVDIAEEIIRRGQK